MRGQGRLWSRWIRIRSFDLIPTFSTYTFSDYTAHTHFPKLRWFLSKCSFSLHNGMNFIPLLPRSDKVVSLYVPIQTAIHSNRAVLWFDGYHVLILATHSTTCLRVKVCLCNIWSVCMEWTPGFNFSKLSHVQEVLYTIAFTLSSSTFIKCRSVYKCINICLCHSFGPHHAKIHFYSCARHFIQPILLANKFLSL